MMKLPEKMKAIAIREAGDPEVLVSIDTDVPVPKDNELLVKIHAAGVNRPDVAQRQGVYLPPADASPLPGLEIAGEVVAKGKNAVHYNIGAKVVALIAGGGYAQYAVVDGSNALPIPQNYDYIKAAAIPETFFTVWSNVFDQGQLKSGEIFLVHGGSSGIGTTAIQLAKSFGAKVIATAGTDDKCEACLKLGCDLAINYKQQDFVEEVEHYTQKQGVNLILDMVGGDYTNKNYKIAAIEGRIVQIAFLNGYKSDINLNYLMRKRLMHTGSTLRPRDVAFKAQIAQALFKNVWPLLESGKVSPLIDKVFALEDAAKAHQYMESSSHIGKIVFEIV